MKKRGIFAFLFLLLCVVTVIVAYGGFFVFKFNGLKNKISISSDKKNEDFLKTAESLIASPQVTLDGQENKRINILLLGTAGVDKAGRNLTDTIMVASLNLETNQVALISIPRDLYVKIPQKKTSMKINSVYQYGLNQTSDSIDLSMDILKKIISEVTSLEINYFIILNFDGFEKIIDSVGGVNVINERDILDDRYPGPNYSYEKFELSRGFHELDGKTALKYVRERHGDPEGDFGRAKRQQQVMQSFRNKVFSIKTLLNIQAINELFTALGNNLKTDIEPGEIDSFLELGKKIDTSNINSVVITAWEKDSLLRVSHVQYGDIRAFILIPRVGNYSEIHELSQNSFDLNAISRRKDEISKENARLVILDRTGDAKVLPKIKKLFQENFNYKNVLTVHENKKDVLEKTTCYDLTNGLKPFTLDELVKKLPAVASYENPQEIQKSVKNTEADIVVTLGQDIASIYNVDEDSFEEYKKAEPEQDFQRYMEFNFD